VPASSAEGRMPQGFTTLSLDAVAPTQHRLGGLKIEDNFRSRLVASGAARPR